MRMRLWQRAATLVALMTCSIAANAAPRPTVLELYTSEGCSSCPPAEKQLEELSKRSDVLPLAFHVDYWDSLGWRDRFSMKEATQRQQDAARTLALSTVGTPQWVVDGHTALWGANPGDVERALKSRGTDVPVDIERQAQELIVHAAAPPASQPYEVYVIGYLPKAVTAIGRGENAGRTLTEVNVVRYIRKVGTSSDAAREWRVALDKLPKDAERVAVLLQTPANGAIVGVRTIER
jgi:hypothetical protein